MDNYRAGRWYGSPKPFIIDVIGDLAVHPTKKYVTRPLSAITTLTIHHTVSGGGSNPLAETKNVASYHVTTRDWPGIGYHFTIGANGSIYQVNKLETKSFHAGSYNAPGDENLWSVGIALLGNFTSSPPPQVQQDAARVLVAYLKGELSAVNDVRGHRQMPGAATACPGATWEQWLGYVAGGEVEPPDPPPPPTGNAQLGLHASADPGDLSAAEIQEFKAAKPGVIKVLSAHAGPSIAALANQHPGVPFIIRAFLDFGGRVITPTQFFNDTINDTKRAVDAIGSAREIWVELHNEPNLTSEGLGASWADGAGFNSWLLAVLALYKAALPAVKYIYPGLSPQFTGYRPFLNASLQAAMACDGVGVHCYWSNDYSMNQSLVDTVDWYAGAFGSKPLWVTEASHNKPGVTASQKGLQYITFWNELKKRPSVKGVCYFVASASNPAFGWGSGGSCETWLGQGIAAVVGAR